MNLRTTTLAAVVLAPFASIVWAGNAAKTAKTETYKADPVHCSVLFRIRHMDVCNFYGRFNEIEGTYTLSDDPAACSFDFSVKVASIDTHNKDRDGELVGEGFFAAEKHPTIQFKSKSVKAAGKDALEVAGELTMRGVTKPLTVIIRRTGAGPDMWGGYRSGIETSFTVKRSDFGVAAFLDQVRGINPLGDEVKLTVSIEGVRQKDTSAD